MASEADQGGDRRFQPVDPALARERHGLQQSRQRADGSRPSRRGGEGFRPRHRALAELRRRLQQSRQRARGAWPIRSRLSGFPQGRRADAAKRRALQRPRQGPCRAQALSRRGPRFQPRHHPQHRNMWRPIAIAPTPISPSATVSRGRGRRHRKCSRSSPSSRNPDLLLLRARAYAGDKKFNSASDDLNKVIEAEARIWSTPISSAASVFTQTPPLRRRHRRSDPRHRARSEERARPTPCAPTAKLQAEANDDALYDINQALQIAPTDPLALRIRGNIYEAL